MIRVEANPKQKMVHAHMSGLLTAAELHDFARDVREAVQGMGLGPGEYSILIETEGNVVQTKEIVNLFEAMITHPATNARRIATVRQGALGRMQSRRLATLRNNAEVFANLADAEAWLASA